MQSRLSSSLTKQCELLAIVAAAMLPGDNVLDLMRRRTMLLSKQAVLATITRPVLDEEPGCRIHLLNLNPSEMTLGFEPQD
jgi:hypothetical protein